MRPRLRHVKSDISDGEILHAYATAETKLHDPNKELFHHMNQTVMNHHIWVRTCRTGFVMNGLLAASKPSLLGSNTMDSSAVVIADFPYKLHHSAAQRAELADEDC